MIKPVEAFLEFISRPKRLRANGVLCMNERNYNIISKYNKRKLYPLVDDKVQTKMLANKIDISTPHLISVINYQHEVKNFLQMLGNHKEFVIKPAHGSGGKGVLVIKSYNKDQFISASGYTLTYNEVYQHISNILSGLFSLGGRDDVAVLEELVHFSDIFSDYSYQGIPDVRVIVYKGFPIMSMMRLATKESGGRANLHQGAVGVGLAVNDGHALCAVLHNKPIEIHPDTNAVLKNLKVPLWREHLIIAAKAYDMTGLGYLGADIVLDKERGPMMLELNARPGLAIQIANGSGLKAAIKKVEKYYPQNLNAEERVDFVLNQKN